jgi:cytochrome c-type biogenesis protein CcmH
MFSIGRASRYLFFALTCLFLLSAALPAQAQEPTVPVSDDDVNEVAKQLYCPICESTPLDVCATQACADWREVIRTKLAEGQSAEDIKAYFELQYGPQALAEPPRSGFTLAVWILPVLAFVVAAFFFVQYLRSLRTSSTEASPSGASAASLDGGPETPEAAAAKEPPAQDDYRARIESELREM